MYKKDKKKAKGKAVSKRGATLRKMATVAPARSHPNDWAVDTHLSKQVRPGGRRP